MLLRVFLIILPLYAFWIYFDGRYFTSQSNILVMVWCLMAIIFEKNLQIKQKLGGRLRGAVTLYITVTFLVYGIFLSSSGAEWITSIILHYIVPIGFIIDWFLTETPTVEYQWRFLWMWIIYPFIYLGYVLINGFYTGFYPYFFLDLSQLGIFSFLIWVSALIAVFLVVGSLLIGINRFLYQRISIKEKNT